jgi:hypothetical protein
MEKHSSQGKQVKRSDITYLFTASGASKIISYLDGHGRYDVSLPESTERCSRLLNI